ncbi:MAG TPA: bifunctional riboflavin kinase/FAD synthetase [Puia sp.]|nr:bifunctional riboflavin kinase/FAD synthetase [Puia sp.]
MQVYRNSDILPCFNRAVITIGTFDGVHTGHQEIIRQLKQEAKKIAGETVIITFDPHPRKIVGNAQKEIRLINSLPEKIELLARNGIDHLVIIPFTEAFSQMTAEEYIGDFLIKQFRPHTIIIGYDHRFGRGRLGNYQLMEQMSSIYSYELCEIPVHVLNQVSVSSTRIREAISNSDMLTANSLLGYTFFFEGKVVEGNKLGRMIGYPTANLEVTDPEKLLPGNGVYAVELAINNRQANEHLLLALDHARFKGMMNIGFRPTVDGSKKVIEVNIFDFDKDIYDKILRVYVRGHLREEQKFNGIDALKEQLGKDRIAATASLKD